VPSGVRAIEEADCPGRSTACAPNGRYWPCGVIASTLHLGVGGCRDHQEELGGALDGGTPGITSWVAGSAALASQFVVLPWEEPAETSAATRPLLVCTSIATTLELPAVARQGFGHRLVRRNGNPGVGARLDRAASVIMLMSTLAAREFDVHQIELDLRRAVLLAGPTNQMSEPGSPQRRLARPELCATSASTGLGHPCRWR